MSTEVLLSKIEDLIGECEELKKEIEEKIIGKADPNREGEGNGLKDARYYAEFSKSWLGELKEKDKEILEERTRKLCREVEKLRKKISAVKSLIEAISEDVDDFDLEVFSKIYDFVMEKSGCYEAYEEMVKEAEAPRGGENEERKDLTRRMLSNDGHLARLLCLVCCRFLLRCLHRPRNVRRSLARFS